VKNREMGGLLSVFWEEGQDNFLGLSEEEAKEIHDEIKKEYGHPKWGSVMRRRHGGKKKLSEIVKQVSEANEKEEEKEVVVVGVDGEEIDKELLKKVIQDWESLESEQGATTEEEDNVKNIIDDLGDLDDTELENKEGDVLNKVEDDDDDETVVIEGNIVREDENGDNIEIQREVRNDNIFKVFKKEHILAKSMLH
jgi:hypothetical protein